MTSPVIRIDSVSKSFRDTVAVNGLSFAVDAGQVFGLLGPNGSGKTTTIRMILGVFLPDEGSISLWDRPPAASVRERVGYLPEERGLYEQMTVIGHLMFLAELHGVGRAEARQRAERRLAEFDASGWATRKVGELSKGQQQTVQLIGAILHKPGVVILDEPFTGLDPVNTARLQRAIRDLAAEGTAVLLSTHRMDQVEQLCDALCLISRGSAVVSGDLHTVKSGYARNTVHVVMRDRLASEIFSGPDDQIAEVTAAGRGVHLTLREGVEPQEALLRAVKAGVVERFEVVEPTLEEVFIEAVRHP